MMDKILFTGNAYIKKNSKEIIGILLNSGYIKSRFFLEHEPYIFIDAGRIYSTGSFFDDDKYGLNCFPYGINCLDNLDFFLAIAMMRKDTDKNQWFISTYNNQETWFISDYDDVKIIFSLVLSVCFYSPLIIPYHFHIPEARSQLFKVI